MKINAEEIKAVANLEPLKRYKYLIKKIADNEVFYTLLNSENDYAISELENHFLIPFWSAKEFAESCLIDDWKTFKITEISLDDFEEKMSAIFIEAIKEQQTLIDTQKTTIETLNSKQQKTEQELASLKAELEAIKAMLKK